MQPGTSGTLASPLPPAEQQQAWPRSASEGTRCRDPPTCSQHRPVQSLSSPRADRKGTVPYELLTQGPGLGSADTGATGSAWKARPESGSQHMHWPGRDRSDAGLRGVAKRRGPERVGMKRKRSQGRSRAQPPALPLERRAHGRGAGGCPCPTVEALPIAPAEPTKRSRHLCGGRQNSTGPLPPLHLTEPIRRSGTVLVLPSAEASAGRPRLGLGPRPGAVIAGESRPGVSERPRDTSLAPFSAAASRPRSRRNGAK